MRVRVTRIDDRPTYLPLPESGELEFEGRLWPEYLFEDDRVYLTINHGEYSVILDGTREEFMAAIASSDKRRI
jgi:hypothetical protein